MGLCAAGSSPGAAQSACRGLKSATDLPKIVWTEEAVEHLEAIVTYVSVYDPIAAERLAQRLIELAESLAEFPHRGRDAGDGRREMTVVWPYVLRYLVDGDAVFILRIRHGARDEAEN
jgi:toxin ParE1/3/4